MNKTRDAERDLLRAMVYELMSGSDEHSLSVQPHHIYDVEFRAAVEAIRGARTYPEVLHGPCRETVLSVSDEFASAEMIPELYRIVKDHWIRREVAKSVNLSRGETWGIDELLSLKSDIGRIESEITEGREVKAAERFEAKLRSRRALISTGMPSLDRALHGGIEEGEKIVIAARPSGGKTSLAVAMAVAMVENGEPVDFHSVESPDDQIIRRAVASKMGISMGDIKARKYSETQMEAMIRYGHEIQDRGLSVHQDSGDTSRQVATRMLLTRNRVCIVDHLQKFRGEDMRLSVGDASHAFAAVADKKGKVIIMCSQMNRQIEGTNREPTLGDLKESGEIEQDADIVIFIHVPDDAGTKTLDVVDVKFIIAKARDGGRGYVEMKWRRPTCTFYPLDYRDEQRQTHF